MADSFLYDVFLSHGSKDTAVVRDIAEQLKKDGLNVWFDEWVLKPGDSIPTKIEEGLEHSRVLVLCMSAQAFGSDRAQLEAVTSITWHRLFRAPRRTTNVACSLAVQRRLQFRSPLCRSKAALRIT